MCKLQSAKYVGATASRGFLKHTRYVFLDVLRRMDMLLRGAQRSGTPLRLAAYHGLDRVEGW